MKWFLSHLKFPQFHASFLHDFTFRLSLYRLIIASYSCSFSLIYFFVIFLPKIESSQKLGCSAARFFPILPISPAFCMTLAVALVLPLPNPNDPRQHEACCPLCKKPELSFRQLLLWQKKKFQSQLYNLGGSNRMSRYIVLNEKGK